MKVSTMKSSIKFLTHVSRVSDFLTQHILLLAGLTLFSGQLLAAAAFTPEPTAAGVTVADPDYDSSHGVALTSTLAAASNRLVGQAPDPVAATVGARTRPLVIPFQIVTDESSLSDRPATPPADRIAAIPTETFYMLAADLRAAAGRDDVERVKALLIRWTDTPPFIDAPDAAGRTALHIAVGRLTTGSSQVRCVLLNSGADPNRRDPTGRTILDHASSAGHPPTALELLSKRCVTRAAGNALFMRRIGGRVRLMRQNGESLNSRDKSMIFGAIATANMELFRKTINYGQEMETLPILGPIREHSLLSTIVLHAPAAPVAAAAEMTKMALQAGEKWRRKEVFFTTTGERVKLTPVQLAIQQGRRECVAVYLANMIADARQRRMAAASSMGGGAAGAGGAAGEAAGVLPRVSATSKVNHDQDKRD